MGHSSERAGFVYLHRAADGHRSIADVDRRLTREDGPDGNQGEG